MLKYNFFTLELSKKFNVGNFIGKFYAFAIDFKDYQQMSAKIVL